MREDPIVEEVHRIRERIMDECENDLDKVFDRIQELEKKHPERLVRKEDLPKAG